MSLEEQYLDELLPDEGELKDQEVSEVSTSTTTPPPTFLDPHDFGPATIFYRKNVSRPQISDIREQTKKPIVSKQEPSPVVQKMSTFLGVFLPIIVFLMGMTYWNRVGKLVGDCGVVYSLAIIWVSSIISVILISSLTAMATNGEITSGGIHYVISRTIGPELGRCFTIFLDMSTCLSAGAAIIGLSETIVDMYEPKYFTNTQRNDIRVIGFIILIAAVFLCRFVVYSLRITASTHLIGFLCFLIGCFVKKPGSVEGFKGASITNFKNNSFSTMTLHKFMGHIYATMPGFTALTGCFANAHRLEKPPKMIKKGLWSAYLLSMLVWHITIIVLGFVGDRDFLKSGIVSPIIQFNLSKWIGFITIVVFGVHRSVANVGYEKSLLTDLAKDELIPKIEFNYDLWIPLIITSIFVGIGNLDFAANINTILFLTMSFVINSSVFIASNSHIPGWRPKTKFWHPYISLLGSFLTLFVQFMISWQSSIINWVIFLSLLLYSLYKGSDKNWGSVLQAQAFYRAYTHCLKTQRIKNNPKLFRINLLTVVKEDEKFEWCGLGFIKHLVGDDGFCIVNQVLSEDKGLKYAIDRRNNLQQFYADKHKIFYDITIAKGPIDALYKLMLLSGLGAFRANTIFIDMDVRSSDEIYLMTSEVLEAHFNLIMATRPYYIIRDSEYIDVYWLFDDGGLTLLVSYIVSKSLNKRLRLITIVYSNNGDTYAKAEERSRHLLERFRIEAEIITVELNEKKYPPSFKTRTYWNGLTNNMEFDQQHTLFLVFSDLINAQSSGAALIICTLFVPSSQMTSKLYKKVLKLISHVKPAFIFVRGNGDNVLSWKV